MCPKGCGSSSLLFGTIYLIIPVTTFKNTPCHVFLVYEHQKTHPPDLFHFSVSL
jgi:hypothetical protein